MRATHESESVRTSGSHTQKNRRATTLRTHVSVLRVATEQSPPFWLRCLNFHGKKSSAYLSSSILQAGKLQLKPTLLRKTS